MARTDASGAATTLKVFFWAAVLMALLWLAIDSNHFQVASHTSPTAPVTQTTR